MNKLHFRLIWIGLFFILVFSVDGFTANITGRADAGYWFLFNNTSKSSNYLEADGYGNSYVDDTYSLLRLSLDLDMENLLGADAKQELRANLRGRSLMRIGSGQYSLGTNDRYRVQLDEANLVAPEILKNFDLWLGRQVIYEAGSIGFDGVRGIYHLSEAWSVGLYAGLGNDPQNLTGYIGPAYRKNPFSLKFQTFGTQAGFRSDSFKTDFAVNALLFEQKIDRVTYYQNASYRVSSTWSLSGSVEGDVMGNRAFRYAQFNVITRPTARVTNTISGYRYQALIYKESNSSAIPVSAAVSGSNTDPTDPFFAIVNKTDVTSANYISGREHIMLRVFDRNYVFGAFTFTRRSFDSLNQLKYTLGYRDPDFLDQKVDLRLQADLVDNYRGFNTFFDVLLGKDFAGGKYRMEAGGSYSGNERDVYVENVRSTAPRITENESSLRFNALYMQSRRVSWVLGYTLYREVDSTNENQKILLHEFLLNAYYRF